MLPAAGCVPFLFFISGKPWTRSKVRVATSKRRAGGGGEGPVLVLRGDGATPWGQSVQISIFSACSGRGALHLQPSISIFAGRHLFLKLCKTCFFFYVYFFCTGLKRCIFIARSQQRSRKLTGQCLLPAALHACCSRASTLLPAGSSLLLIPLAPFVWREVA